MRLVIITMNGMDRIVLEIWDLAMWSIGEVHERRACHETLGRLLEWNMVWHVYWNYIFGVQERSWRNCRSYITLEYFMAKECNIRDLAYQTYQYSTFLPAAEDMCVFLVFNIYFKYPIYSIPIYIRLPSTNKRDYYDIFIKQNSHDWYHIENILLIWWLQTTLRIDL